jgi:hypothetical protein
MAVRQRRILAQSPKSGLYHLASAGHDLQPEQVVATRPQIADAVLERVPSCRTLFMSGYTDNMLIQDGRIGPGIVLLSKPFPRATVAAKIREILDAPA